MFVTAQLYRQNLSVEKVGSEAWENLDDLEKDVLAFMVSRHQENRA